MTQSQEVMSQEESNLLSKKQNASTINDKNNRQWKKRVNLFRLVYSFLITNNSEQEIISNIDEDDISDEKFKEQKEILKNIIDNFDTYKEIINKNLRNWTFERISYVDKALFLCALGEYNVLHTNKKIIIDQTLVTTKRYSNPISCKYINAILDKILK